MTPQAPTSEQVNAPWFATCDWGDCDGTTVGFRFDDDADGFSKANGYGWLPVCQAHYDEETDESRRMKVQ